MTETIKLPNGQYKAIVTDYGIKESKAGKPMAVVKLKVYANTTQWHFMSWFGTLSDQVNPKTGKTPREFVIGALQKINPKLTINALVKKTQQDSDEAEFIDTEVSVAIVNEMNPNTNLMVSRVKYINPAKKKFDKLKPKVLSSLVGADANFADFEEDTIPF